MSYILRRTDGTTLSTISDGGLDSTTTSLSFPGKNYSPYSELMADNLVKVLENFSGNTAPVHALSGQIWYDRSVSSVKVYATGNVWRTIGTTVSSTEPTTQAAGEFWFNSVTQQLYVKNSSGTYVLVGPTTPAGYAETDVKAETITDNVGPTAHQVLGLYAAGRRTFILNSDAAFTTDNLGVNLGFANVYTGLTANTAISTNKFGGTSIDSDRLGTFLASEYLRSDIDQTMTGNINIRSNTKAFSLGTIDHLVIKNHEATSTGILENTKNAGWIIRGKIGVTPTDIISVNPTTGAVTFSGAITSTNIDATTALRLATPRNIAISGFVNGSVNFDGSGDVTLAATTTYTPVNRAGDTMTGTLQLPTDGLYVGAQQLSCYGGKVGINVASPVTTLDIDGSIRTRLTEYADVGATQSLILANSAGALLNLTEVTTAVTLIGSIYSGQSYRIVLLPKAFPASVVTPTSVTFTCAGSTIIWPNNVTPNLFVGTNKIAIVTFIGVSGANILATFVTY